MEGKATNSFGLLLLEELRAKLKRESASVLLSWLGKEH